MPRRARLAIILVVLVFAVLLGIGGSTYVASQHVPSYYAEALVEEPEVQEKASDEMLYRATTLASDVQKKGTWQAKFTEQQINGWLAVDLKRNYSKELPPGVSDPRVSIQPDRVFLACRYEDSRISTVCSLEVDVYLAESNLIGLRLISAKAGALPLPLKDVVDGITRGFEQANAPLRWQQADGDPVALIPVPSPRSSDNLAISIDTIQLEEGAIILAGRTLDPDEASLEQASGDHALHAANHVVIDLEQPEGSQSDPAAELPPLKTPRMTLTPASSRRE